MSNKKDGSAIERLFAQEMYDKGWWVHIFADKVVGQPFDIVMARVSSTWFLDVKHVTGKDYLLHSRFEENQKNAFKMLHNRNVDNIGFVVKFDDEEDWYLLKWSKIDFDAKKTYKKDMIKLR